MFEGLKEPLFEEERAERQPRVPGPRRVMERVVGETPDPQKWQKMLWWEVFGSHKGRPRGTGRGHGVPACPLMQSAHSESREAGSHSMWLPVEEWFSRP